jgi:predicted phosphodiesterase
LLILSDIHLEFEPFSPQIGEACAVILAGDIHVGTRGVAWARDTFPALPVLYVLGNHEFYGHSLPSLVARVREAARGTNVHVLENDAVVLGDTVVLGCTLWTDFDLYGNPSVAWAEAAQHMADYHKIRVDPGYRRLRPLDMTIHHHRSLAWLAAELEGRRGRRIVIVTHHSPSPRSAPERYAGDPLNPAFVSPLDDFVAAGGAVLWIHGHLHDPCDYSIGGTRVLCNPKGYPGETAPGFAPGLVVEV